MHVPSFPASSIGYFFFGLLFDMKVGGGGGGWWGQGTRIGGVARLSI